MSPTHMHHWFYPHSHKRLSNLIQGPFSSKCYTPLQVALALQSPWTLLLRMESSCQTPRQWEHKGRTCATQVALELFS